MGTRQGDVARQVQRYGSREVLRLGVQDVELLERLRQPVCGDSWSGSRNSRTMCPRASPTARMGWTSRRPHEVCEVFVRCIEQSYERLETAVHGVCAGSRCVSTRIHTSDVSSAIHMLEELVSKYEGPQRQEIRQRLETAEVVRHTSQADRATVGAGGQRRVSDIRVSKTESKQLKYPSTGNLSSFFFLFWGVN